MNQHSMGVDPSGSMDHPSLWFSKREMMMTNHDKLAEFGAIIWNWRVTIGKLVFNYKPYVKF